MSLQFGLTPELTNTQFAPVAALAAYYEAQNVLQPLQLVTSEAKQSDFTLENKLTQVILSVLTGCEFISLVNTRLRPEQKLAQLYLGLWTNHEPSFNLNINKFVAGLGYEHSHIPTQAVSTRTL